MVYSVRGAASMSFFKPARGARMVESRGERESCIAVVWALISVLKIERRSEWAVKWLDILE